MILQFLSLLVFCFCSLSKEKKMQSVHPWCSSQRPPTLKQCQQVISVCLVKFDHVNLILRWTMMSSVCKSVRNLCVNKV